MRRLTSKFCLNLALLLTLLLAGLTAPTCAQSTTTESATSVQSDLSKRQEAFQIVWQTVNDVFYDPKFGGVDWAGVRKRYEPQVATLKSDRELHALLQQMLNELHQSHFVVIPRDSIPKIRVNKQTIESEGDDETAEETDEPFDAINYKLTDRLLTGIGIDVRVLEGSAVVSRVAPGSTAERAGLRPGFVIKKVGDRSLDTVIAEIEKHPLWGAIIRPELPVFLVAGFINGEPTSPVKLGFLDARNRLRTVNVKRERLKGEMSPAIGNLPAMYTEFEARRLPGGLGYIRFNAFVPSLMEKLCGALRTMKDAPGIILDLRGNQGGLLGMIGGLTGLLEASPTPMGTMQMRHGRIPLFVFPQRAPYSGRLVILLDGSTQSAGEMFASGLREANRASLVGERTAGNTLPSAIKKLPTGALFQYGFANYQTSSGKNLEGLGLTPDLTVKLSRRNLLRGVDPQLSAGIRRLREEIRWGGKPVELIADVSEPLPLPPVAKTSPPKVTVKIAPPAEAKGGTVAKVDSANTLAGPSVDSIFEKYLEASGGRAAFEKLTSRVSTGTVEITALGITGAAELSEQAPGRSNLQIDAPGLGIMQSTFDGSRAWLQDPMQGFIRFTGLGFEMAKAAAVFNKQAKLKELYPNAVLVGKEKLNGKDAYVIRMGFERWYFDVESGLLMRKGSSYFEDYREVDGIKLPFKMRDDIFSGSGIVFHFTQVKHNIKIDESKFTVYPSCFTKP